VIICPKCGHENPADPRFCANCGEYLPWDDSTREGTELQVDSGARVSVTLDAESLHVAGGEEVECEVRVRNTGKVVDQFTIVVLGGTAAFAEVDPDALRLMPNQENSTRVRFRPPRSPDVAAGRIPFTVQVTSRADPTVVATADASLDLEPFSLIRPELVPKTSEGRRVGEHRLIVANAGNQELAVGIEIRDPDQKLRVAVRPRGLQLAPGTSTRAGIEVRPRRVRLLGQSVTHPFQVVLTPEDQDGEQDAAPVAVDGAMLQRALLPTWVIPVAAALLTLLIGMIAFAANQPEDPSTTTTIAATSTSAATTTTAPTTTLATSTTPPIVIPPAGGGGGTTPIQPADTTTSSSTTSSTSTTTTTTTTTTTVPPTT
jgi:hypothetical protein